MARWVERLDRKGERKHEAERHTQDFRPQAKTDKNPTATAVGF